jgi:hypothetical protein
MVKIPVPRPAKGSFNKDRPISDLLKSQLKHFHEAERNLPYQHRTGRNVAEIKTEGEASAYIAKVMSRLHVRGKIKVPRPAAGSFHKHRPPSDLLKSQIEHFHEAEMSWPEQERTGVDVSSIKTEHEAAEYIRKVTARLHPQSASPATNRPGVVPVSAPGISPAASDSKAVKKPRKGTKSSSKKKR